MEDSITTPAAAVPNRPTTLGNAAPAVPATLAQKRPYTHRLLAEASSLLAGSLDYEGTLVVVGNLLVPEVADWCIIDLLEDGILRNAAVTHADSEKARRVQALRRSVRTDLGLQIGPAHVAQTGEPEVYADVTDAMLQNSGYDSDDIALKRETRFRSAIIVPLIARRHVLGVLTLLGEQPNRYARADVGPIRQLAYRCALAVDVAQVYRAAQEARDRADALLPKSRELADQFRLREANENLERRVRERTAELDLTNRKLRAELDKRRRIQAELARQAEIIDLTRDAIITTDTRGVVLYWSRGAEEMYGWTAGQAAGHTVHQLIKNRPSEPFQTIQKKLDEEGYWDGELVHTRRDGKEIVVASRMVLKRNEAGDPLLFLEVNTDITEAKRAEREIAESRAELRRLAAHLESVREEEQARLAYDIHERFGQALSATKIDVAMLAQRLVSPDVISSKETRADVSAEMQNVLSLIEGMMEHVSDLAHELHPAMLDMLGLNAALDAMLTSFGRLTRIRTRFESNLGDWQPDLARGTALFRIAESALKGIAKQGSAGQVQLSLDSDGRDVLLVIEDDRVWDGAEERDEDGSVEMARIKERALALGGQVSVESSGRIGTRITVRLPMAGDSAAV